VWDEIVRKHNLRLYRLEQLAAWAFGDFIFGCDYDVISDTTKLRQHGFHRVEESEAMFLCLLRQFRETRIIP